MKSDIAKQVVSGLIVAAIGAAVLAAGGYAWQVATGGGLIRILGGVVAGDVEAAIDARLADREAGRTQTVTLVEDASDASPDSPLERRVCIGPGNYFLSVRGIRAPDGRYVGRARLTSDPPGSLVDLQVNPNAPLSWGFVTSSQAACYQLIATAPARLYWLLDW